MGISTIVDQEARSLDTVIPGSRLIGPVAKL
jgi:hypothetical protein